MLVLGLDTSTSTGSIALVGDNSLLSERLFRLGPRHSETLVPYITDILKEHNLDMAGIKLISVSIGPGSFTGLRVGLAAAKGICLATKADLVGISSLRAIAWNFQGQALPICAAIDARRNQVYAAKFSPEGARLTEDMIIEPEKLAETVDSKTIFAGSGARLYAELLKDLLGAQAEIHSEALDHPRGSSVAELGLAKLREKGADTLANLEPTYVRKSNAELNV